MNGEARSLRWIMLAEPANQALRDLPVQDYCVVNKDRSFKS